MAEHGRAWRVAAVLALTFALTGCEVFDPPSHGDNMPAEGAASWESLAVIDLAAIEGPFGAPDIGFSEPGTLSMAGACVTFQSGTPAILLVFTDDQIDAERVSKTAFTFQHRDSEKVLRLRDGETVHVAGFESGLDRVRGWESPPAPECGDTALFVVDIKRAAP